MKITNDQFFIAKRDPQASAFMVKMGYVNQFEGKAFIDLCLDIKEKYSDKTTMAWVQVETELRIDNYSNYSGTGNDRVITPKRICFHQSFYRSLGASHIITFLDAIKKDSDVKFRAVVFNGCDYYKGKNLVHHSLYGIIDDKKVFFLADYVGADNSASPVQY